MLKVLLLFGLCPAFLNGGFIEDIVERHNHWRTLHNVPNVTADSTMNAYAQQWADHLNSTDTFEHRTNTSYGENLSWMWRYPPATGTDHVDNLYIKEAGIYETNGYCADGIEPTRAQVMEIGHYSQIVWKSSTTIGVGHADKTVVINYKPRGNMLGSFVENVLCPQ